LVVGISASQIGVIYLNFYTATENFVEQFGVKFAKEFINNESFKKYVNWAYKLPKSVVNNY